MEPGVRIATYGYVCKKMFKINYFNKNLNLTERKNYYSINEKCTKQFEIKLI